MKMKIKKFEHYRSIPEIISLKIHSEKKKLLNVHYAFNK